MSPKPQRRVLVLFGNVPLYGQERATIDDMEALRSRGWGVLFVTHPEWGHLRIQPELDARGFEWKTSTFAERFDRGIGLRGWWRRLKAIARGSLELQRIAKEYRPSVIHVGNLTWFVDFLPALLWTHTPMVYRMVDIPSSHRLAFRLFWRYVVGPQVEIFICISGFVRDRLQALARVKGKTCVIYSRPPKRLGRMPAGGAKSAQAGSLRFGYVGQINEEKGVGLIIDAALRLCIASEVVEFDLAGDLEASPHFAAAQAERVRAAGLESRIRFLGYVGDLKDFYAGVDVHLCPSIREEALGLTVMEAKEMGKPSIVFLSGGLPEMVEDGREGFVCVGKDAIALEQACRVYLTQRDLVDEHGAAAQASLDRLGVSDFENRLAEAYEKAARRI